MSNAIPTVVIVGRPNVGKSTLFNRITGQRRAIVGDEPGITRDRIHGQAEHDGRHFELIDTGGIVVEDQEYIPAQILHQARSGAAQAPPTSSSWWTAAPKSPAPTATWPSMLRQARQTGLAGGQQDRHRTARRSGARILRPRNRRHLSQFVGARHRRGCAAGSRHRRLPRKKRGIAAADGALHQSGDHRPANVGKSTLLNTLTGQERAIVSPIAGTTRDAVDEKVSRDGVEYVFVDTAGIRRKGKTRDMAEKLSVVMARRHIRMAHVVLLMLDATEGRGGARRHHRRLCPRRRPRGDYLRQ
jgi:GTPase